MEEGGSKTVSRTTTGGGLLIVVRFGFLFTAFFPAMSLKHSACHTFRASEGSRKVFKMHLKSRKIDSMGDHISGKNHSKSVAGAVKVPSWGFALISWIPFGSFGVP